jgi:hypothetical protein
MNYSREGGIIRAGIARPNEHLPPDWLKKYQKETKERVSNV